jgi:hypothetical protein
MREKSALKSQMFSIIEEEREGKKDDDRSRDSDRSFDSQDGEKIFYTHK